MQTALEDALDHAVLAIGPVQRRERHVAAQQPAPGLERHRLAVSRPAPAAIDLDRHRLVPGLLQPGGYRGGRLQRDGVLAGPATGEDRDPHGPSPSGGGVGGAVKRPTTSTTDDPESTLAPVRGRCSITTPS